VPQQLLFVTITDTTGCSESFSINLEIVPHWIVDAQIGSSACTNNAGQINLSILSGPGGYTFQWSNGAMTEDLTALSAGFYSVTITSAQGCQFFENFNVPGGPPQPNLGPRNLTVCGTSYTLGVGSQYFAYQWNTGATSQSITVSTDGTYYVNVWDSSGCLGSDTITLQFLPPVNMAIAGPDPLEICQGDTAYLNAINPNVLAYLWNTGQTSGDIFVQAPGTYTVVGTAANGCTDSASVTVIVNPNPTVSLGPDTAYCALGTVEVSPGPGFAAYLWSTGDVTDTLSIGIQGGYWVEVTDGNGCSARDTILIGRNPLPTTDIGLDTTYCVGTPFSLDAGAGFVTYEWNVGGISQTLTPQQSGPYQVVVSDSNGCYGGSNTVIITILPLPVVPVISIQGNQLVSTAATTYQWYYEGNPIAGATGQSHTPTQPGYYTVEVTDANGCGTTLSAPFLMVFQITNQHVPEGFSPNGDGIHDQFMIKYIEFFPENTFTVFNRWGQPVFSQFGYDNTWEGQAQGGKPLPDGTYFYELKFPDGQLEPVSGYFILNR
jgi:gliding motility-associated-like protein